MFQTSVLSFVFLVLLSANGIQGEITEPYFSHENANSEEEAKPYPGGVDLYVFVCITN